MMLDIILVQEIKSAALVEQSLTTIGLDLTAGKRER